MCVFASAVRYAIVQGNTPSCSLLLLFFARYDILQHVGHTYLGLNAALL